MGRSNLAADGQQWDHDWSNSEALAAQRGQKMSTKDDHVSTSALDGAKAFDIRLQQQQQQQVQDQHASSAIFDSYRSPRAQQQAGGYFLLPPLSRSSLPTDRTTHVGLSPRPRPALCA
ncbi:hypothetical protein A4X06_0g9124 [Tilletia controversa]|uniref:Uncharacterized protein n=1 Tax=Tilletia controversa TaxID=13291 RepID=A0A8X7SSI6_9BASI|nr:hypothetical protein CF335_g8811 [Tilletia laevis]KAE8237756.1 hypothetical protein A4X06_0g9124 [Tilletia controversa]CAD6975102.1 unnamed protein product [Tilletia controversa]